MIVFDIACANAHRFEGWFADGDAFAEQRDAGSIPCPFCGNAEVERVLSVPRIKSGATPVGNNDVERLAKLQAQMLKDSTWVGDKFAERARGMAEGEEPPATIHGQATLGDARALAEDGIKVLPLPFPVTPPESLN